MFCCRWCRVGCLLSNHHQKSVIRSLSKMDKPISDRDHIRHCILYEFDRGSKGTEAHSNICNTYGDIVAVKTIREWYSRFRSGNRSLENQPRSGRPIVFDNDALRQAIEEDPRQTIEDLSARLGATLSTVKRHLHEIGKVCRAGVWVPHDLTPEQKINRLTICNFLLAKNSREAFLKRIITSDEKFVLYENPRRQSQWLSPGQAPIPTPKGDLHPRKILLCVWWDYRGIIYFELLPQGKTVTAAVYCAQLDRLHKQLLIKRPALVNRNLVVYHCDNARGHTAKITQQKLRDFKWEVLPQPPYSPDLSPSDYHLFRSLEHFLSGKKFKDEDSLRSALSQFFDSKDPSFYQEGIEDLVKRWSVVADNNGEYFTD